MTFLEVDYYCAIANLEAHVQPCLEKKEFASPKGQNPRLEHPSSTAPRALISP